MSGGRLAGRTAVVVGGGHQGEGPGGVTGIGFATATTFARHGARVAVVDRDADSARRTVQAITDAGGQALALVADATDDDQVRAAVDTALGAFGRIDVVHTNVGVTSLGSVEDITIEDWRTSFALNLDTVFLAAKHTLPHLAARGGSLVAMSSVASIRSTGYPYPGYAAAKAAVNQLTRSIAIEYAGRGVRANAILAGLIDTPLVYRQLADGSAGATRADRAARSPTGAMGTAQDVADAALFLASDESRYITGVLLPVDGGLHVRAG
ncbi:SDR family NAD(P)-dependent oxidoreductase [Umezawaea sp. Da 62-37]|uniref:SDR family NAD(P)-dependent oxidoreductase n=1 Tax=Umezawaea sp. Da 62-37 TaxID=3075927 RepID=UPI0028F707F6|nr:SDR family NAD(P)-dependent oxidoreductase [Umezawaea sp. Da 62-37]WNV85854.1 SDR family NAD(P)-dependent oxidoreductase [Umezawaea sp. Da 62-37]